jgi:dTDP-4-amino-4,6-dideoxygalactose transaminase
MSIPFIDLKTQYQALKPQIQARIDEVLEHGQYIMGPEVKELEDKLAAYTGSKHCITVASGTEALLMSLMALGIGPGDEIVTTPFTFAATPHVLSWNKATPVFADIDPETMCIDPASVEHNLSKKTSAILGVHVYGMPCDVHGIDTLARQHQLRVIYDGAHAFGTQLDGRPIIEHGDATMLSFHATKLFHSAEGGALCMADPELKKQADLLKNFGIKNEEEVLLPGINGKMNELQAALGCLVLQHVDTEKRRRQAVRDIYKERLRELAGVRLVEMPSNTSDSHQYLILRVNALQAGCSRDELYQRLKRFNIITRKYFYPLCSEYDCYRHLPSADPRRLPNAHRVASEVLSLPLHGTLSPDDVHRISDAIAYSLHHP